MSAISSLNRLMSFCEAVKPFRKAVTELSQATGKDKRVCALALAIVNAKFFKTMRDFLATSILANSLPSLQNPIRISQQIVIRVRFSTAHS